MGCHRRYGQEEWFLGRNRIVEETVGLAGYDIGRVASFITHRLFLIPLPCAVQVRVRVWVQEKVRASKPSGKRRIVIVDVMSVEELAGIVGIDSSVLQPYRKVSFVQAQADELGIATCSRQKGVDVDHVRFDGIIP